MARNSTGLRGWMGAPGPSLKSYARIVGEGVIRELQELADPVRGLQLVEVNSTRTGGGVAEMLPSFLHLAGLLGLRCDWRVLEAPPEFYHATKTLHNFLQGNGGHFSRAMERLYRRVMEENAGLVDRHDGAVTIHDPQPMGLVAYAGEPGRRRQKWLWRCHVHLETLPRQARHRVVRFMRLSVEHYDGAIFSTTRFLPLWRVPSFVIPPFIDPLSDKNRPLPSHAVDRVLDRFGIDRGKPIVTQVSRFDHFKDPVGVIRAFRRVRARQPCQLLLVGGSASDDPESLQVLAETERAARGLRDVHILHLEPDSHRDVNALQRASDVVVQKSLKEGFGLTVSEALWKGRPVVGGRVGGIPLQIRDGWDGFLVSSIGEAAARIAYLLRHPEVGDRMGRRGREWVRDHFLLPRGVQEHLLAIRQLVEGQIAFRNTLLRYRPWEPLTPVGAEVRQNGEKG